MMRTNSRSISTQRPVLRQILPSSSRTYSEESYATEAVIEKGSIRIAGDNEQSTYILKPAPWDETLRERRQIPANEHLTMQVASKVYGIKTVANGLCFTPKGRIVHITKRFDILPDGTKIRRHPSEEFLFDPAGTRLSSGSGLRSYEHQSAYPWR